MGKRVVAWLKTRSKKRWGVGVCVFVIFGLLFISVVTFPDLKPFENYWFRNLKLDISKEDLVKSGKILRDFFPLPPNRYYLSEEFPLIHGSLATYCGLHPESERCSQKNLDFERKVMEKDKEVERPDIFLISWESLSGSYLPMTRHPQVLNATPELFKNFKDHGVFYHECVVSGSPSANSLWTTVFMGPSLHKANFLQTDYVNMDSLYSLMKRTISDYVVSFVSTANPPYDRQNMILDQNLEYLDEIYFKYENGENYDDDYYGGVDKNRFARWNNDRILIEQAQSRLKHLNQKFKNRPIFQQLISMSTHIDFSTLDKPLPGEEPFPTEKRDRYIRALQYSDKHLIGNLVDHLKSRERGNNTVVIVIGDHGAFGQQLGYDCDCPRQPFDGDQVFYTTATLLFFGSPEQRAKLGIPKPGTVDYTPCTNLDIVATIVDLAGGSYETTSSLGRSLLNPHMDKSKKKTISMTQSYAELGLSDIIVRMNWLKTRSVSLMRPHPTYFNESYVFVSDEHFSFIEEVADAWHNLVFADKVWNPKFIGRKPKKSVSSRSFLPFGYILISSVFLILLAIESVLKAGLYLIYRKQGLEIEKQGLIEELEYLKREDIV
ncbi:hypothetical protein GEMRC1_006635 [Eukaryota sp. GEM-RC1]